MCSRCGAENTDKSSFCESCGSDLTDGLQFEKTRVQDSLDGIPTDLALETANVFETGTAFAERYIILSEAHKGGMGIVYKCKDTKLNKVKALKVIHPRLVSSVEALSRFRQEVAISQELQHENIIRVYDLAEWQGNEYFTMEWVDGGSLRDLISRRKKKEMPFSIKAACAIICQLADALEHAHHLTVHRDIKPENILITDEKELKLKLGDFGIAKMMSPSQFIATSLQMGTPYYMAPEQKDDVASVDIRADIYSLGVIFFELLTLENRIGPELPSEVNGGLPKEVDVIFKKAVASRPDDRYGTAREFSEALCKIIKGVASVGQDFSSSSHCAGQSQYKKQDDATSGVILEKPTREKSKGALIAAGIILLIALSAIMYKYFLFQREPDRIPALQSENGRDMERNRGRALRQPDRASPKVEARRHEMGGQESVSQVKEEPKVEELKALINPVSVAQSGAKSMAIVIQANTSRDGRSPSHALYYLFEAKGLNVVPNLFQEKKFIDRGFFREIYEGDDSLLLKSGAMSKIDYLLLGKLTYSFVKGNAIDADLVSSRINLTYKVIDKNGFFVKSDSINVTGPGFSEEASIDRGLEILSEKCYERIAKLL